MSSLKSSRTASIFVFGGPLNKHAPDLPGWSRTSCLDKTTTSVIKGAGTFSSGYKIGQNGADSHSGANSVPTAQHRLACMMIRGIRYTGGQNQLLSSPQSQVKASTASSWIPESRVEMRKLVIVTVCETINCVGPPFLF